MKNTIILLNNLDVQAKISSILLYLNFPKIPKMNSIFLTTLNSQLFVLVSRTQIVEKSFRKFF
jgi:hypothetical protein